MRNIAYQNKDITSKLFAEAIKEKSFAVYGIKLSRIKSVMPTNLPMIEANEMRIDNLFLLEDDSLAIVDYESEYESKDKIKYLNYVVRVVKKYGKEYEKEGKKLHVRMIVLYTADVIRAEAEFDVGCVHMTIEQGFLSTLDTEAIYERLQNRIEKGAMFEDQELMELIVLPLTIKGIEGKREMVEKTVGLAKNMPDEQQQFFALAGILTFSDKIISDDYSKQVKEWIMMTKVARLFEEEKIAAVKVAKAKVTKEVTKEVSISIALKMKKNGMSIQEIAEITGLSEKEIVKIRV